MNRVVVYLLIGALLQAPDLLFGQIILAGNMRQIPGNAKRDRVFFFKPIEGFNNIFYKEEVLNIDSLGKFNQKILLSIPAFINVRLPRNEGILSLFASNEDSIYVDLDYDTATKKLREIDISGSNAKGHSYYLLQKNQLSQNSIINDVFSRSEFGSINDFINNCFERVDTVVVRFNTLTKAGFVDSIFTNHVTNDLIGFYFTQVFMFFESFCKAKSDNQNNFNSFIRKAFITNEHLYTSFNYESLKKAVYLKYDPNNPGLTTSSMISLMYPQYYYKDIENGIVESNDKYDTAFLSLDEEYRPYGYMKGKLLEYSWGRTLYWAPMVETDKDKLKANLFLFKKYFPHSQLLPVLETNFKEALIDLEKERSSAEISFLTKKVNMLSDLGKIEMKNELFFVDLWATWCTPCVQEFVYKNRLNSYLKEKKIATIYISIDRETEKAKWERFVKMKNLYGYHILANSRLKADLKKLLYSNANIAIPRYFLINNKGQIISKDLPRPSSIDDLKKSINEMLR